MFESKITAFVTAALLMGSTAAQDESAKAAPKAAKPDPQVAIQQAIDAALRKDKALMIAVVHKGRLIVAKSQGQIGEKKQADDKTLFPLGSASQILTCMVLERLDASKRLPLSTDVGGLLTPFELRDESGGKVTATLRDVLRGRVKFPEHRNFLERADVDQWPTLRAVREHAIVSEKGRMGNLSYAVLQAAAEAHFTSSWSSIVRRNLTRPLGMTETIADARTGLPIDRAGLYREGLFGLWAKQPRCFSSIPAAHGAWMHASDLGKLLQALLRECGEAETSGELEALVKDHATFAEARVWKDPHAQLAILSRMPGAYGGFDVFPKWQTAWAVFTNSNESHHHGVPGSVRAALKKALLPKIQADGADQWNTAIGLGGGTGGRFRTPIEEDFRGEWTAEITLQGKKRTLWIEVGADGIAGLSCSGHRDAKRVVSNFSGKRLYASARSVLPIPVHIAKNYRLDLMMLGSGKDARIEGVLKATDEFTHLEFHLAFGKK